MNTNKPILGKKLSELFREIPLDNPSPDFAEKLLIRIEKEVLQEKRKQQWLVVGQVAAGIASILLLPALVLYLCTIFLPDFSFALPKIRLDIDKNILVIGFSVLILLIIDALFRMHAANRTKYRLD